MKTYRLGVCDLCGERRGVRPVEMPKVWEGVSLLCDECERDQKEFWGNNDLSAKTVVRGHLVERRCRVPKGRAGQC